MGQDSTDLPDTIPPRRFEYADDKSYKYWTIALSGLRLTTRYGRIGSSGQTREVRFASVDAAKRNYAKRIRQKTNAGYEERVPPQKKLVTSDEVWQRMEDHEPFLQAILDDPDDLAGYAVYADWLIERDDPLGEFTQLQLALEDPTLALFRRPKIENAAKLLRQKYARAWLGHLAPWLMDYGLASYPYDFFRGQLSSIACYTLSLRFAYQLRRSPHCRMLRELAIQTTEVLSEPLEIDHRRYEANRDYGLETLVGADFSNLREFYIGMLPGEFMTGQSTLAPTTHLLDIVESMPRLETLYLRGEVDLYRLTQMTLPKLTSLHVTLRPEQLSLLSKSGIIQRLRSFGILSPLTEPMIDDLIQAPGFDQLTEFSCREMSRITDEAVERLKSTGVVISVLNFAP